MRNDDSSCEMFRSGSRPLGNGRKTRNIYPHRTSRLTIDNVAVATKARRKVMPTLCVGWHPLRQRRTRHDGCAHCCNHSRRASYHAHDVPCPSLPTCPRPRRPCKRQ
jgi:hypothetical protein